MYTAPSGGDCQRGSHVSVQLTWSVHAWPSCKQDRWFGRYYPMKFQIIISSKSWIFFECDNHLQNISNMQHSPPLSPLSPPLSPLFFSPSLSLPLSTLSIQQVEPFLCDCVSISKRIAQAIEPFSQELHEPKNLEETEKVLHKHQLKKRRTFDKLQIDQLTTEGLMINRLIKQESEERYYLTLM